MRIEIRIDLEDKLLKSANSMNRTPTEYVNFLIEYIEISVPEIKPVVINIPTPQINLKKTKQKINDNFVRKW